MRLQSYKDLEVWKRSMQLVNAIYGIAKELPQNERFGLISQVQRAAVSIPSNIAEGYTRKGTTEYLRFLSIANGSSAELETHLLIIKQQYPLIDLRCAEQLNDEVQKMLYGLIGKLKPSTYRPRS